MYNVTVYQLLAVVFWDTTNTWRVGGRRTGSHFCRTCRLRVGIPGDLPGYHLTYPDTVSSYTTGWEKLIIRRQSLTWDIEKRPTTRGGTRIT